MNISGYKTIKVTNKRSGIMCRETAFVFCHYYNISFLTYTFQIVKLELLVPFSKECFTVRLKIEQRLI